MSFSSKKAKNDFVAVLLCAGRSSRVNSVDKTTFLLGDMPIFIRSLTTFLKIKEIKQVVVVASRNNKNVIKSLIKDFDFNIDIILGGLRRQDSVKKAIKFLKNKNVDYVIIHDAARPFFSEELLKKGMKEIQQKQAVIPVIEVQDTLKRVQKRKVNQTIDRTGTFRSQTPQFFNFADLSKYFDDVGIGEKFTDESQLVEKMGGEVFVIDGEKTNEKITNLNDLEILNDLIFKKKSNINVRHGIGVDVHKLVKNRKLFIGGVHIPYSKGLRGHSDADVVIHSIADSILGACGKGDLGQHFPSSNPKFENETSTVFLEIALQFLSNARLKLSYLDLTVILEKPKIIGYSNSIRENLSRLLSIEINNINFKITSTDGLGLIGDGEGIGAICSSTVIKQDD